MRVVKSNRLLIALLASLALAACSSTPTDKNATAQQPAAQPAAATQPVQQTQASPTNNTVQQTASSASPANFWNDSANYDGTTNSRIIYFSFDASNVPSASFDTLRAHAKYLKSHGDAKVRLEGNTDERGTQEYNIALGERRAKAVSKFLLVQGVSPSQIETVSYGKEKPAALGHDDMSWAKNRRVVIDYTAGQP